MWGGGREEKEQEFQNSAPPHHDWMGKMGGSETH